MARSSRELRGLPEYNPDSGNPSHGKLTYLGGLCATIEVQQPQKYPNF